MKEKGTNEGSVSIRPDVFNIVSGQNGEKTNWPIIQTHCSLSDPQWLGDIYEKVEAAEAVNAVITNKID